MSSYAWTRAACSSDGDIIPPILHIIYQFGCPGALGRSGGLWAVTLCEGFQSRRFGQDTLLRLEANLSLNLIPLIPSIFDSSLQRQ